MSTFNYLSGFVSIDGTCPDNLREGLNAFYEDPNDELWGSRQSRVLYHESIHFWQLLSSGYLGMVMHNEWGRLLRHEQTGILDEPNESLIMYMDRGDRPFAPQELVEAWARFWDVHSRSPVQVIEEEGISVSDDLPLMMGDQYSGEAFEWVMENGPDCGKYAAPYRWLVNSLKESWWLKGVVRDIGIDAETGQVESFLAALVFPVLVHRSFGTPQPVEVFCGCVEYLNNMPKLLHQILRSRTMRSSINYEWLASWNWLNKYFIDECLAEHGIKGYDTGLAVINVFGLDKHEVYADYVRRFDLLKDYAQREREAFVQNASPGDGRGDYSMRSLLTTLADGDAWAIFGLPGQPNCRMMLGHIMPPTCVRYDDHTIFAPHLVLAGSGRYVTNDADDDAWRAHIVKIGERVDRFNRAIFANEHGFSQDDVSQIVRN